MDILYIVRPGEKNEELRYSLRSVWENVYGTSTFGSLWIAGYVPPWVRNARKVELEPVKDKFANQRQSLAAALAQPELSDPFWLFNDDMFVMEPVSELPVWHLGPLADHIEFLRGLNAARFNSNGWRRGLATTYEWLRGLGVEQPDSYEAHIPLPFSKRRLSWALEHAPHPFLWGAAFDLCGASMGHARGADAKVTNLQDTGEGMLIVSTSDRTFAKGVIGRRIRARFRHASTYEEETHA